MKAPNTTLTLFTFFSMFSATQVFANVGPTQKVEIGVQNVMAPAVGFDDNDLVQLVVDARLPNACFQQGTTEVTVDEKTKTIVVRQFALRSMDGVCGQNGELPDELKVSIPFMSEVSVGQLSKGEYQIQFLGVDSSKTRKLNVDQAPTTTVDSLNYATVTNAFVQDVLDAKEAKMKVTISGILNSSCTRVSDVVYASWVEDVLVILPQVKVEGIYCIPQTRFFTRDLEIPMPAAGRYLLHVRSNNGKAKNHLFTVE